MLPSLVSPELFFGLCSPIGTDTSKVEELIKDNLRIFGYSPEVFKVTELMVPIKVTGMSLIAYPPEDKYNSYIEYANKIREISELPSVLASLCCLAVRNFRRSKTQDPTAYVPNTAYIFNQFKRKEEIELLRQIYGRLFIVVSIYSDKEQRVQRLTNRIAMAHLESRPSEVHRSKARELVKRDESEEEVPSGQRIQETFPTGDIFINADDLDGARDLIRRFFRSFFGSNSESPTHDEYGMYLAKSVSLRSLDLSRQVGAAIVSKSGEVITLGCNEVPKAKGGTYWEGDKSDDRDYKRAYDSNDRIKRSILVDFTNRLKEGGYLNEENEEGKKLNVGEFISSETKKGRPLRDSQLMDLLEFGRIIHAEMLAISDAARLGRAIKGATLYCTTFPCHICAKHIVASGIERVVYIEPYPKSYAEQLHNDAIVIGKTQDPNKVSFEPFIGVSPFRYRDLFERGRRKDDDGNFLDWMDSVAQPIVKFTSATYLYNEREILKFVNKKIQEKVVAGLIAITDTAGNPITMDGGPDLSKDTR